MSSDSGQKFIKRNRPPRVHISYQDPYDAEKQVELPFVMGVMADLSGNASKVEKPAVGNRKFADVDMDNFDKYIESVEPAIAMKVENKLGAEAGNDKLGIELTFKKFSDFEPAEVVRQIPALRNLLEAREQLANLLLYVNGKAAAEDKLRELLTNPEMLKAMNDRRQKAASDAEADTPAPKSTDGDDTGA